ncbi:MAG: hypothetical protein ACYDBJ_10250 [Aggregatilineales bacterium]
MEQLIITFVHDHCGDNYAVVLHLYQTGPTITVQSFHPGSALPNAEKVLAHVDPRQPFAKRIAVQYKRDAIYLLALIGLRCLSDYPNDRCPDRPYIQMAFTLA